MYVIIPTTLVWVVFGTAIPSIYANVFIMMIAGDECLKMVLSSVQGRLYLRSSDRRDSL